MARFEFEESPPTVDYVTVPQGRYVCTIAEVAPGSTRNGDPRWGIKLVISEGEFTGRLAAWDGLVFSERGTHRARRVLGALGLPNTGEVELDPADLVGRRAIVEVRPAEYDDRTTGQKIRRNEVAYDGYLRLPESEEERHGSAPAMQTQARGEEDEPPPF